MSNYFFHQQHPTAGAFYRHFREPRLLAVTFSSVTGDFNCIVCTSGSIKLATLTINTTYVLTRTECGLWTYSDSTAANNRVNEWNGIFDCSGSPTSTSDGILITLQKTAATTYRLRAGLDTIVQNVHRVFDSTFNTNDLLCATPSSSLVATYCITNDSAVATGGAATFAPGC